MRPLRVLYNVNLSQIIHKLRELGNATAMTPEIRRYIQDIVVFMRLERGVAGGVSPHATTQFVALAKFVFCSSYLLPSSQKLIVCPLSRYLAPLHNLDFVTPSLVALAARKIYPHRLLISAAEHERSMQYGSDLDAVQELLDGVSPETVIEAVINTVPCPL